MSQGVSSGHLGEETLVWHYYGDDADAASTRQHLDACPACRVELERLKAALALVDAWPVPERDAGYGERVWDKLAAVEPALATRPGAWRSGWRGAGAALRGLLAPRRLALAGALGVLLVGAFFAGRSSRPPVVMVDGATPPGAAGERILAAALSDHLAQSGRILLEILNRAEPTAAALAPAAPAEPGDDVDMLDDKARAASLLDDNRLYRLTAARQGQLALASVLEDLERVLLDVARGPEELSSGQLASLRERLDDQQLVFKVRVLEARLRELGSRPPAASGRGRQEILEPIREPI